MRAYRFIAAAIAVALALSAGGAGLEPAAAQPETVLLPTGQSITPLAAPGAAMTRLATGLRADGNADASGAMATALSPDEHTLLVLTSGYNYQYFTQDGRPIKFPVRDPLTGAISKTTTDLTQWIFVYRLEGASLQLAQRISLPDAFCGIAWAPDGTRFYVSGGIDDRIAAYKRSGDSFVFDAPEILLGHNSRNSDPLPAYDGGILNGTIAGQHAGKLELGFSALAAGLAISDDGRTMAVANMNDDSVSIVDTVTRKVTREVRLFTPGSERAGGEYPYGVAIVSDARGALARVYAGSMRDGDVSLIEGDRVVKRISVGGEPNALLLAPGGTTLYVANGDNDEIDAIDTASDTLTKRISVDRPGQRVRGANPNGMALDGRGRMEVSLGGENAVAIVDLTTGSVLGRIPAGWYPTSVAVAGDRTIVTDAKAVGGPNPGIGGYVAIVGSRRIDPSHRDQYVLDLEKANVLTMPTPSDADLAGLTRIVDAGNGFGPRPPNAIFDGLRGKIHHVIFIMKENRTYDQVLGDLPGANGDPRLTSFPYAVAPNHHELARQFVTFDNFYTGGDVSSDGWNWTVQGRSNEYTARTTPISYASDGFSFDTNGTNRGINLALPTKGGHDQFDARVTTLLDPSGSSAILPGGKDIAATQGDGDESSDATGGYIWDAALRAGKTVRHYGMYSDETYYKMGAPFYIPIVRDAYAKHALQSAPARPSLQGKSDRYFRGWDLNTPDRYRFEEWKREFDGYVRRGDLPSFEAMSLMMDHFGQFATNAGGLNTPFLQMSDDDYAVGRLVETVAHSRYWKDTAIFVMEDDSQDGPDHVDAHRSPLYVISAYTRRHAVVHTHYSNGSVLRTIEDLLGLAPLGMIDANAPDLSDAFMAAPDVGHRYRAVLPADLCRPPVHVDLIPECRMHDRPRSAMATPRRGAAWWIAKTRGMNFDRHDAVDPAAFNTLLQIGL